VSLEEQIINKILLLYLINKLEKPVTIEKLEALVFLCQLEMTKEGIKGFTYEWIKGSDDHKKESQEDE